MQGINRWLDDPVAELDAVLDRLARSEDQVQAFCALDLERAKAAARASRERQTDGNRLSPVDGMVIGVKDIIDTVDLPTRLNSALFDDYAPAQDAVCVERLKKAGAIIIGKTVTTEFAMGRSGPTRNPHDLTRTPGGSSSGAAASVAAGMAHAGLATQTQGSILRPAAYCGVVGYKPSHGRLPVKGIHPVAPSIDHLGVIAGSVNDCWVLAQVMAEANAEPLDSRLGQGIRVGVLPFTAIEAVEEAVERSMQTAIACLERTGAAVTEAAGDTVSSALTDSSGIAVDIASCEMVPLFGPLVERHGDAIAQRIRDLVERGRALGSEGHADVQRRRTAFENAINALFERFDVLIMPTAPGPAPVGHAFTGSRKLQVTSTLAGLPAFTIPCGEASGMPLGVQLIGAKGTDAGLASLAQTFEPVLRAG